MKAGDKIYCIKRYINSDGFILNEKNQEYSIQSFVHFHGKEDDIVVSVTTNTITVNVFWLKYKKFNDDWEKKRKNNLFNDFFITEKQLRQLKLEKLNESRR